MEKALKYREEGNKLFQADKPTQAVLFYNKAISYSPHPSFQQLDTDQDKVKEVQFVDEIPEKERGKRTPSRYEALALSYANRSAALRRLSQFEDCLKDVSRAAKFGYPKENLHKLWERKGKCYHGLRRYDLASKCYRQALQCLKESGLSDNQKGGKVVELQELLKDIRNIVLKSGPSNKVTPAILLNVVLRRTTSAFYNFISLPNYFVSLYSWFSSDVNLVLSFQNHLI